MVAAILVLVGLALTLIMLNRPTAALVVLPLGLALLLLIGRRTSLQEAFILLLVVLGLGILGGIELIYLRDFLDGGDWSRMNTVFKFGMPAWILLGLASSVMLPRVWRAAGGWAILWRLAAAALLVAGLFFLPFGITGAWSTGSRGRDLGSARWMARPSWRWADTNGPTRSTPSPFLMMTRPSIGSWIT